MRRLILLAALGLCAGCIQTPQFTRGPGSTHYDISVRQYIDGQPMEGKTDGGKGTAGLKTTGGGNINITIVPVGDSRIETQDDNSAAKNATATTKPSIDVTP